MAVNLSFGLGFLSHQPLCPIATDPPRAAVALASAATTPELRHRVAALRRHRKFLPTVAALGSTFVLMTLAFQLLHWRCTVWTGLIGFFLIGLMQYRLVLASHEATHRTLLQPVWLNEVVGVFCASLVGVSFFNYRRAHLEHHRNPQSVEDDIDGYIYRPLLRAQAGWPRFLLLFTGNYADILTKLRRKFFGDGDLPGSHALVGAPQPRLGQVLAQCLPIAVVQGALLAVLWHQIAFWAYFVFWLAPILVVALQLDRIRTFLEHGYNYFFPELAVSDLADTPQSTIDVETNFLERYLFAPFGFSDHQAHHLQMNVPFYHLPELRTILQAGQPGYIRRIRASYLTIFVRMIRAPLTPQGTRSSFNHHPFLNETP